MACSQVGQKPFEAWSLMVMHISHLLLGKTLAISHNLVKLKLSKSQKYFRKLIEPYLKIKLSTRLKIA